MTSQEITLSINEERKEPFQTERVVTIFGAHFIHDTFTAFVAPLLPMIMDKLSLSLTMIGSLTAFMQFPSILNPFIGYLADKISLRYFVIFSPAITATLICSMGTAPSYASLAIILFMTGLSSAAFHSPAPAMVGRISGNRVGKGMSIFMAGGELGRTLGPLLALWAVSFWTLEGIYRIAVLGWGASLILLWRLREVEGKTEKSGSVRAILPILKILYLPLLLVIFLRQFLQVLLTTYLPTFLNIEGSSLFSAGASLSILEIAGVGGALVSGTLSDRVGRKTMLFGAIMLSSMFSLLYLRVDGWFKIPLLLLTGFTALSTGPVFLALVQDNVPNNRAIGNGIYMSLSFLLRSVVLLLVGVLGDAIGLRNTFYLCVGLSFLSIPFIFFLPKYKAQHDNTNPP
jgi:FSR family fosmidomycin resistance protein-like MFS transporter